MKDQSGYSGLRKSSSSWQLANQKSLNICKASADWSVVYLDENKGRRLKTQMTAILKSENTLQKRVTQILPAAD